jgi:hypothetical protein
MLPQTRLQHQRSDLRHFFGFSNKEDHQSPDIKALSRQHLGEAGEELFSKLDSAHIADNFIVAYLTVFEQPARAELYLDRYIPVRNDVANFFEHATPETIGDLNVPSEEAYLFGEALLFWYIFKETGATPDGLIPLYLERCMSPGIKMLEQIKQQTKDIDVKELAQRRLEILESANVSAQHQQLTETMITIANEDNYTTLTYQTLLLPSYIRKLALDFYSSDKSSEFHSFAQACLQVQNGLRSRAHHRITKAVA